MMKLKNKLAAADLSKIERVLQQIEKGLRKNTTMVQGAIGMFTTGFIASLIFKFDDGYGWTAHKRFMVSFWFITFMLYIVLIFLENLKDKMGIALDEKLKLLEINVTNLDKYQQKYMTWVFAKAEQIDIEKGYNKAQEFLYKSSVQFNILTAESIDNRLAMIVSEVSNISYYTSQAFKERGERESKFVPRKPEPPNTPPSNISMDRIQPLPKGVNSEVNITS